MTEFSKNLKRLRLSQNISQKQISELLHIADRQYRRYENGEVDPPITFATQVADIFNVSIDYLVGRSDDPTCH